MNPQAAHKEPGEPLVVFEDVVKVYDDRRVLDGLSFTLREGEFVSLTGESMTGKSTILKIISGLVRPEGGKVTIFSRDMLAIGEREKREVLTQLEMQFQSGALFDSMRVDENIQFVLD